MAGRYSLYDGDIASENYLRGVQESDADGKLSFQTIFPAAYSGRWPHIHFEVYEDLDAATAASSKLRTSQIALPEDVCDRVFATPGYEQSVQNLAGTSLESDMVFSDGYAEPAREGVRRRRARHHALAQRRRLGVRRAAGAAHCASARSPVPSRASGVGTSGLSRRYHSASSAA